MAPRRRTYASRGFARRRGTRFAGSQRSTLGALIGVLGLIGLAVFVGRERLAPMTGPLAAGAQNAATATVLARAPAAAATPPGSLQLTALETPTPQPSATPTAVVTLRHWDASPDGIVVAPALVGQLDQALIGVEGTVGIAVKDLGSGRGAVLDGMRELQAASLYKLPILFAVFDSGLSLAEELPITDEARAYDTGTMELGTGETLSVAEALERMVTLSDNTSAIMLGGRVGGPRITRDIAALGMDSTHYSLERMTTSPQDMLALLELVARGRAVSPAASAEMVHLLLRQRVNDRLPRLLPDDVRVAHKTGNLPGVVNDVGILYGPNSTVAIAALVSDTTNEAAAAAAIARVGLIAHSFFDDQPAQAERPRLPAPPARAIPPTWREPRPTPTPTEVPTPPPPPTAAPQVVATVPASPPPTAVAVAATAAPAPTQPAPTAVPTRAPAAAAVTPTAARPQPTPSPVPTQHR